MSSRNISGFIGGVPVGDDFPVRIIGVINLTKNSFYSGSVRSSDEEIILAGKAMEEEGANIVDVGARSTAPYRRYEVTEETEKRLLTNAVNLLSKEIKIPISADTTRLRVAKSAIAQGATIINDVFGLTERDGEELARLVSTKECSLILTAHEKNLRGNPDPIKRVMDALSASLKIARDKGVEDNLIAIDPGIGFFSDSTISNVEWNCTVLSELNYLRIFGFPICLGVSRKRFIGTLLGDLLPEERLLGSLSATAVSVLNGAHIIRTHDVRSTSETVRISLAIRQKGLTAKSS